MDEVNVEIDEDGDESTEKLDCIGWQLDRVIESLAENMSVDQAARLRYDIVKTLVIEEGITEIPDDEFDNVYPRTITLPSTLVSLGYSSVNASFAESLTVNSKGLDIADGVKISAYQNGAEPFASIDEALEALIASDAAHEEINLKMDSVYDLGAIFELSNGIDNELDAVEFLDSLNEKYGADKSSLEEYIPLLLERINENFGTDYSAIGEVFQVVTYEYDYTFAQRDPQLDSIVNEMHDAVDIGNRLFGTTLGTENEDAAAYQWLTVNAPAGSKAEEAAKIGKVPFNATSEAEIDNSFLGKVKAFFVKVKEYAARVIDFIKTLFGMILSK